MDTPAPQHLRFDEFELDEGNAQLTRRGQPVQLPPKAFSVLCELTRRSGKLVRKDDLLDAVWGHRHVSESVLKTTISQVRAALADDAASPKYIETASRRGYRFIGKVGNSGSAAESAASAPAEPTAPNAAAADAQPTESTSSRAPLTRMIGRLAALEKMRAAWGRARAGQRAVFWIAGEAGVGKTTLIDNFVSGAKPATVAYGQCVEQFGAGEPYLPVLEALGSLCRRFPELATMARTIAPTWLMQLPWLVSEAERAALHRELAGTSQERMVRELGELIGRFTRTQPVIFVTEDLHWADPATLRLIDHFARGHGTNHVMWLASFRLTQVIAEGHPLQELRRELKMHRLCEEILLDPFSETEVAEYLESRFPQVPAAEHLVRRLHAHTDGLPLFVVNVVDALLAQGVLSGSTTGEWANDKPGASLPVPEDLAGAIERRVSRLPAEARTILEAASACGLEFRASMVAQVLGQDVRAITDCCDDLVQRKLWLRHLDFLDLPDGTLDARYAFQHALYKHVFYHRMGVTQRIQHHRNIARALQRSREAGIPVASAELATHHELGREVLPALKHYADAAVNALSVFAPTEAVNLTGHALTLLDRCPDTNERMECELALVGHRSAAFALLKGVGSDESREACLRVRALCDLLPQTPARAVALRTLGWLYYTRGEYEESLNLAKRVYEISQAYDDQILFAYASNIMGVTYGVLGDHVCACEWLERGIEVCQELGERAEMAAFVIDSEVSMRANICIPLMHRGLVDQALRQATLARERAYRIRQPMARMLSNWTFGMLATRLDDPPKALEHAAEIARIVAESTLAQGEGPALWLQGWAEANSGDPRLGHQHVLEGYARHARYGMYAGCTEVLGYAAEALILDQRLDEAEKQLDEALQLGERIGERAMIPNLLVLRAQIALRRGGAVAARPILQASVNEARAQEAAHYQLKALLALAELADSKADDVQALRALFETMSEGKNTKLLVRTRDFLASHLA